MEKIEEKFSFIYAILKSINAGILKVQTLYLSKFKIFVNKSLIKISTLNQTV
ncbi:MAG: hypothetical protein LBR15_00475 [Methanobrevibacter sp.]|nr:hypothetical protein [Candidatus Methanovirga australis]